MKPKLILIGVLFAIVAVSGWLFVGLRSQANADASAASKVLGGDAKSASYTIDDAIMARLIALESTAAMQKLELESLRSDVEALQRTRAELPANAANVATVTTENYENGQPRLRGAILNGLRIGHWESWHPNGKKADEGEYLNGLKAGIWRFWSEDGKLQSTGAYTNGIRSGIWTFIDEDGSMHDMSVDVPASGK